MCWSSQALPLWFHLYALSSGPSWSSVVFVRDVLVVSVKVAYLVRCGTNFFKLVQTPKSSHHVTLLTLQRSTFNVQRFLNFNFNNLMTPPLHKFTCTLTTTTLRGTTHAPSCHCDTMLVSFLLSFSFLLFYRESIIPPHGTTTTCHLHDFHYSFA